MGDGVGGWKWNRLMVEGFRYSFINKAYTSVFSSKKNKSKENKVALSQKVLELQNARS